jgi:hypothetical protein
MDSVLCTDTMEIPLGLAYGVDIADYIGQMKVYLKDHARVNRVKASLPYE